MQATLEGPLIVHLAIALAMVVVAVLLTRPVRGLLSSLSRKVFARTETALDDRILAVVLRHVRAIMVVIGFQLAVREIRKGTGPSDLTITQMLEYAEILLYVFLVGLVVKILLGIIDADPDVLKDPASKAFVTDFNETAVQVTLVGRALSYGLQWGAETEIRERAYQAFLRRGIPVPVQRRVVEMRGEGWTS
jgi:hypothetical protein